MHDFLLGTTELGKVALAHVGGKDSIDSFPELVGVVRARCGNSVAALFAEPVRSPTRPGKPPVVTWYAAVEGVPIPLRQLDSAERERISAILRERLSRFSELFVDPDSGPVLASWLHLRDAADVLCIAGQPVLTNWGMVPAGTSESSAMREGHFRAILGNLVPAHAPTPPFVDPEAAAFASRLTQLREPAPTETSAPNPSAPPITAPPLTPAPPSALAAPAAASGRTWVAPVVAVVSAAAILAAINLFHLLRYPDPSVAQVAADRLDLQRKTNQALEERLTQLKQAATNVCVAPNAPGQPKLLPLAPERTNVPAPPRRGQSQPGSTTIADLIDKATVLILNGNASGSGFFISETHIVTNHHVVGDSPQVKVGNRALGGFVDAQVIAVGAGRNRGTQDVAVLEVAPGSGALSLRIGVTPQRLRPVMAAGFPGAVLSTMDMRRMDQLPEANISAGIVTSRQLQQPDGIGAIVHTAQIGHGNSGGPLVDEGACAVGVNSWLALDADHAQSYQTYNESLDAEELRKFLDSNNVAYVKAESECTPLPPAKPEAPPAPAPGAAPH